MSPRDINSKHLKDIFSSLSLSSNNNNMNISKSENFNRVNNNKITMENIDLFYTNIEKLIKITPKILVNKIINSKIFLLFDIAFAKNENNSSNLYIATNNSPKNDINVNNIPNLIVLNKIEKIFQKIEKIFEINNNNKNEDFFCNFSNIFIIEKLEELLFYYRKNNNWRLMKKICFILSHEKIHEHINANYNININNNINDKILKKIFSLAKILLKNECLEIQKESIRIFSILSKAKNLLFWDEVIKFVDLEIIKNDNYYNRRLFCDFFSENLKIFSFKFLSEKGQIEEFFKLLNDNYQMLTRFFKILKNFFPLVTDDKFKFLTFSKLEKFRKMIKDKKIIDNELIRVKLFLVFNFLLLII